MDVVKPTTSFIPKRPIEEARTRTTGPEFGGLFTLVSSILLVGSIVLAAGAFFYERYLIGAIATQGQNLARAEAAFEPQLLSDLSRLNSRLGESKRLLGGHVALTPFFELLERTTLESVSFQSLDFTSNSGKFTIAMRGQARSFGALALQSDVFSKTKQIKNALFSGLNLDQTGNVVFELTADVDPSLVLYRNNATNAPTPTLQNPQ